MFFIDLELVSQILKVGSWCTASAWMVLTPRRVRGHASRKIFNKKGDILGTLQQEKMYNFSLSFCAYFGVYNDNYSDNKIFICLPILIQSLLIISHHLNPFTSLSELKVKPMIPAQ